MSSAPVERERVPQFKQHHRLRLALEVAGLSVQDMADYLGVERNSVGRWINGHTAPRKQTLRLWALYCGVPLEWLETGQAPAEKPGPDIARSEGLEPPTF